MRGIEIHRLRYLGIVAGLLILGIIYFLIQDNNRELTAEKQYWQAQVESQHPEVQRVVYPNLLDLPKTIEECQSAFQEENVHILSVNLDRIETDDKNLKSADQSTALSYALFHFKLAGSWSGIETALQRLENITDQAIKIQEVRLNSEGGDLVLKIYFHEPDKPSQP